MATTNFVDGVTVVEASWLNDVDEVVYETALKKDGSVNPTANLPMNNFKLTGSAVGANAGEPVTYNQAGARFPAIGVGTAQASWDTYAQVDISTAGAIAGTTTSVSVTANSYYGTSNWRAKYTGTGGLFTLSGGSVDYYSMVSATAGDAQSPVLRWSVTSDGRMYGSALHNNANAVTGTTNQYVASGTYTPTTSALTNLSSVSMGLCQWIRVGNVVTVSGGFTCTSTSTNISFEATLPIASNLTSLNNVSGVAAHGLSGYQMVLYGNASNDTITFDGQSPTPGGPRQYNFTLTYLIL